jgi:hypothetical protein
MKSRSLVLTLLLLHVGCEDQPGSQSTAAQRASEVADYYADAVRQGAVVALLQWVDHPGASCHFFPGRRPTVTDVGASCSEQICSWRYDEISSWKVHVLRTWNGAILPDSELDVFVRPVVFRYMETRVGSTNEDRVFAILGSFASPITDAEVSSCDLASGPLVDQLIPFHDMSFGSNQPGTTLIERLDEALLVSGNSAADGGTESVAVTDLCRFTFSVFREENGAGACICPEPERSISFDGGVYPFRDGGC